MSDESDEDNQGTVIQLHGPRGDGDTSYAPPPIPDFENPISQFCCPVTGAKGCVAEAGVRFCVTHGTRSCVRNDS